MCCTSDSGPRPANQRGGAGGLGVFHRRQRADEAPRPEQAARSPGKEQRQRSFAENTGLGAFDLARAWLGDHLGLDRSRTGTAKNENENELRAGSNGLKMIDALTSSCPCEFFLCAF